MFTPVTAMRNAPFLMCSPFAPMGMELPIIIGPMPVSLVQRNRHIPLLKVFQINRSWVTFVCYMSVNIFIMPPRCCALWV